MERTRRVFKGRLSEILGDKTLGVDMFHRTVGIHRHSKEAVKNMDAKSLRILNAYADGVNEFINNIGKSSATLLPPELILLGVKNLEPWTPVDSVGIIKLLNFHLSWNWSQDLLREVMDYFGLEDL